MEDLEAIIGPDCKRKEGVSAKESLHKSGNNSWQSDRATREGRNTIEKALEAAAKCISEDFTVEESSRELRVDKDTKDVPGLPPIFHTILEKIDRATVFVPDFTFVSRRPNGDPRLFRPGNDAAEALEPFFQRAFEQCGVAR